MAVTLAELRSRSRIRADMENSTFISDSEVNDYVNASVAELWDLMISAYGDDYFISEFQFSTTANTEAYSLPEDFYKVRGVDLFVNGNNPIALERFKWNERNKYKSWGSGVILGYPAGAYRLRGSNIVFAPVPDTASSVTLWYIPKAAELTLDTDELDDLNQFSEYVVVDVAIKMLNKEESDVSVLMAQKAALKRRIEEMAQNRDSGSSEAVQDVHATSDNYHGIF